MSQFSRLLSDVQYSSYYNMVEAGSSAHHVWFLHPALPSNNLSLNKYSNVKIIYHSYLSNCYFPCLIHFIFKQWIGFSSGLKVSITTSFSFTELYKVFLMAQWIQGTVWELQLLRFFFSSLFFFFLMTVSNLQFGIWSFDLFRFIFYFISLFNFISFHYFLFCLPPPFFLYSSCTSFKEVTLKRESSSNQNLLKYCSFLCFSFEKQEYRGLLSQIAVIFDYLQVSFERAHNGSFLTSPVANTLLSEMFGSYWTKSPALT